jgi:UDP-N-acetylmuramoylalanine--D-glutamate ligase
MCGHTGNEGHQRVEFSVLGKRVVVVGGARSGVAAAELLARHGARVTLSEQRDVVTGPESLRRLGVVLETGGHREQTFTDADLVVTSPGVSTTQPVLVAARRSGVEVIGELELAWRWIKGRVIAITGTKGKSTTTTLLGRALAADGRQVLVGGNIGVPLSAQVEASTPDHVHVVEVSSFQLETATTFRPWIGVWLNVSADHLDRHPSFAEYAAAKARIFANQRPDDYLIVNADDAEVMTRVAAANSRTVTFSLAGARADFFVSGDAIVRKTTTGEQALVPLSAVQLVGRHMLNNVLAATAAACVADVTVRSILGALEGFHGLEHVMEPAGQVAGVRFINDSKATNVEAARRSIESFERGVVAIIGGQFKGGDLRDLREPLRTRGRAVIAIGDAAPMVRTALADVLPVMDAYSMHEAVSAGFAAAGGQGVVLLAPACASFDWFRDYAERGRIFKEEVQRLRVRLSQAGSSGT